jgi:hypothetical protein
MAKEQKEPVKEYLSEKIKEALDINRKAQELMRIVLGEEIYLARKDKDLLEKEETLIADIKKMEEELKEIALEEHVLDRAVQEKSAETIRKMCDELKFRISSIIRELNLLKSEEHALEEKKITETKELREEWSDTGKVEDLLQQLKVLEERITSLAEKSSLISKAKRRSAKL